MGNIVLLLTTKSNSPPPYCMRYYFVISRCLLYNCGAHAGTPPWNLRHNVSTVWNPFIKVYNLHFSGSHHLKPHTWYVAMPGTEKWKVVTILYTPVENNRGGGSSSIIHDNFRVRMESWSWVSGDTRILLRWEFPPPINASRRDLSVSFLLSDFSSSCPAVRPVCNQREKQQENWRRENKEIRVSSKAGFRQNFCY